MITKTFKKQNLLELLEIGEEEEFEGLKKVTEVYQGKRRWAEDKSLIFKDIEDVYWQADYEVGLTENQDVSPFEYDGEDVTCHKVKPMKVYVTEWVLDSE